MPIFARKYGVACSTCHEVWPKLNDNGQLFRDNGYRFNRERDNPMTQPGSFWPIAMRATAGYQFQRNTAIPSDAPGGFSNTQTGTFGFTGLDILTAGAFGEQLSWLLVYTPGLASAGFRTAGASTSDLESAFFGFHRIFGTPYLNVRIGKHAPDLPLDEHRILTLTQRYAVYHYHPVGSAVSFEPGNNQSGVEIYGHSELSRFRYSVSIVNENDSLFSSNWVASPAFWGHIQGTHYLDNDVLAAVKAGVFGAAGFHPTVFDPVAGSVATGTPQPLDGTGSVLKPWSRIGGELHAVFLSTVYPLTLTGVLQYSNEDKALVASGVRNAEALGGFVEAAYTWAIDWTVIGRYDRVHALNAGADGLPSNEGDTYSVTAALRRTFELNSRVASAFQIEASRNSSTVSAIPNSVGPPLGTTVLLAVDFAY